MRASESAACRDEAPRIRLSWTPAALHYFLRMFLPTLLRAVSQCSPSTLGQHSQLKESLFFLSASRIGRLEPSGRPSSCLPLSSAFCSSLFRFSSLLRWASAAFSSSIVVRDFRGLAASPPESGAFGREDLRPGSLSRRLSVCRQLS